MLNRFANIQYDSVSAEQADKARELCQNLEFLIDGLGAGRSQALAMTHLEESYMWIGKAIKEEQLRQRPGGV